MLKQRRSRKPNLPLTKEHHDFQRLKKEVERKRKKRERDNTLDDLNT